jgi:hypothetical protein
MTNMKTNSTFKLTVINIGTSTGLVTVAVGTGITAVGNLVVAITGSAAGVGGAAQFSVPQNWHGSVQRLPGSLVTTPRGVTTARWFLRIKIMVIYLRHPDTRQQSCYCRCRS